MRHPAVAHKHGDALQMADQLPHAADALRIKNRREQPGFERFGILPRHGLALTWLALLQALVPGQLPLPFKRFEQRREVRQRAATAFGREPSQRAPQKPRRRIGALGVASKPEKIIRKPRWQIVADTAQFDVWPGGGKQGDFRYRLIAQDPGVLAHAAVLRSEEP